MQFAAVSSSLRTRSYFQKDLFNSTLGNHASSTPGPSLGGWLSLPAPKVAYASDLHGDNLLSTLATVTGSEIGMWPKPGR